MRGVVRRRCVHTVEDHASVEARIASIRQGIAERLERTIGDDELDAAMRELDRINTPRQAALQLVAGMKPTS